MDSDDDEPGSSGFEHGMESQGAKRRRVGEVPPKHDIFLSHSGQEKVFVEQLHQDLLEMNQRPFFDQDSDALPKAEKFAPKILEAAEQCRVAVVVVSEGYLTSKWPMLELSKFVEHKRKLFPLFFKLSPGDLKENEVETRWKQSWKQLVEKGEVKEEVMELWSAAVKELRSSNGLEYGKFGNAEYKYGRAAVEEICKAAPPILEWSSDGIQGFERLCAMTLSMFESKVVSRGENMYKCLGLHGMGGVGKTTLCKAMCSYCQGEFGGRVLYVELPSDEQIGRDGCLSRLKGWACLKKGLRKQLSPVFLAIDNVGDFESSREEAQRYVNAGLPSGSKVLVTARSREILIYVLGQADCCEPTPRLKWVEAAMLFLSKAAPNISSVLSLKPEEREIVGKCLSECRFKESGYPSSQYHPLMLRALGTYFYDKGSENVMGWKDALEDRNKLQQSREATNVNDILGLNYHSLKDPVKLVFLDCALYYSKYGYCRDCPWWIAGEAKELKLWVSWIAEVHGVSPSEAEVMVRKLQRLCLVEDSHSEVSIHDLYKEFARVLVEKEGSKEWQWWMSDSSNVTQLKRLYLDSDESYVTGRTLRRFVECRSLVFLELMCCGDVGPDLELGNFNSLRVLYVIDCENVKRVVCSCNNGEGDGMYWYKRYPTRGCLSQLVTVKLSSMGLLEDLPFLRHCWNLQWFEMSEDFVEPIFPAINGDPESGEPIDFRYLKALRTFRVIGGRAMLGFNCDAFIRWLLNALQLRDLVAFEYWSNLDKGVGGYTIDLNEAVQLSPRLSVLSLRLPGEIEEVKGLHLLSELTTLNLSFSRGLRRLRDLQLVPKLRWICVHGCCQLDKAPCVGVGVQEISAGFGSKDHAGLFLGWHLRCLDQYCYDVYHDDDIRCSVCDPKLKYDSLSDQEKLLFLDCALYYSDYGQLCHSPWWSSGELSKLDMWVLWISEVHGMSLSEAKMMVKKLQRLSFLKDSDSEVLLHDSLKEFAMDLVENKGSKEWEWMSESSNATQLNGLLFEADEFRISGRISKRFVEGRNLVFLELVDCDDVGPDLELGSFNSLRVLYMTRCDNVESVVCNCISGDGDGMYCYKRNPARGCLSELVTVKVVDLNLLLDLPFLRHCWNLQWFEMSDNLGIPFFPAINGDLESWEPIDFGYLKALRTFRVSGGRAMLGYDCDAFIKWLLKALQLRDLVAFEYRSNVDEGVGGYTIDLNEAVQLSPRLSVLSLRLPGEIEEVKGLHLLSELTTLNLNFSRGLRRLRDLQLVPKLRWICVYGCCKLGGRLCLGPGVQEISARFGSDHDALYSSVHSQCLEKYCYNIYEDDFHC